MSVVQRCPHCGTTQATSGECEACHEAMVRYFCTNHEPGLWLGAPACQRCGSRLGEPARSAPTSAIPIQTRSAAPRAPAGPPAPPRRPSRVPPPMHSVDAWREPLPPAEGELAAGPPRMSLLHQLLQAFIRARYRPASPAPDRDGPAIARRVGGCLLRLALLFLVLLVLLAGALFMFGRALF